MSAYTLMGILDLGIALAYLTIAYFVAPHFQGIPKPALWLGITFFISCCLTHVDLAVHSFMHSGAWLIEPYMFVIHGIQFIVACAFVMIAGPILRLFMKLDQEVSAAQVRLERISGATRSH